MNRGELDWYRITISPDEARTRINTAIAIPLGNFLKRCFKAVLRSDIKGRQSTDASRKNVQNSPTLSNTVIRLKREIRIRKMTMAVQLTPSIARVISPMARSVGFAKNRQSKNPLPHNKGGSVTKLNVSGNRKKAPIAIYRYGLTIKPTTHDAKPMAGNSRFR
jgi:hypothetical protein